MSKIELKHVDKYYGKNHILKDVNLTIEDGDFMTLLGPSGCGKTTTLRVVSGLEKPQNGTILMNGKEIVNAAEAHFAPPSERDLNLVFQSYALWPHMTVRENIAFGLQVQKMDKEEIRKKVVEMGKKVDLNEEQLKKKVSELSGGEQQRVAIARALVTNPEIICLDEPLSNLDAKLRVQLRNELKDLQKRFGITTVYVTHDQEEALTLSDRIAVFNKGVIEQIGRPDEIYSHSATEFVCNFIGDINRLTPEFLAGTGADKVESVDPKKHCYIRLERMHVNETMATDTLKTEAVVEDYEFYGLYIKYTVRAFGQTIKVIEKNSGKTLYKKGDTVTLSYNPADIMQYEG